MASLNRRKDGPDTEVTVIESPNLTIIDVGEATTLNTFLTFAQLRIDETDFLHHCDATFNGAVRFKGWSINSDGSDGDFWKTARGENVVPDRARGRLALWKHKLPTELDIEITNLLFKEWSYLYVLFGKNFIDDVEYPLKSALSDEDYDEFTAVMNKQRQQLLFQAPYHRRFLDSLQEKGTEAWCRP